MKNNNLTKAYPIRLTLHQEKAFVILESLKIKKSRFIRIAIDEKLKREFRSIIAESKKEYCPF